MSDINIQNFPAQLNQALGLASDSLVGGIAAGLIIMMIPLIPTMFLTRGKNPLLLIIIAFVSLGFATAMTWFPSWMFILLIIISAAGVALGFKDWIG